MWGDGDPEGVRQRAATELIATAQAAARLGVSVVNGFTGSSIWHLLYSFPPVAPEMIDAGYADFAAHYGFTIKPCNVGKGNEKGIVESAVGYVKHNFLRGRPINEFASLNPAVHLWLEQTANVRVHARTRQRPVDMFVTEKQTLNALPPHPYDCAAVGSALARSSSL